METLQSTTEKAGAISKQDIARIQNLIQEKTSRLSGGEWAEHLGNAVLIYGGAKGPDISPETKLMALYDAQLLSEEEISSGLQKIINKMRKSKKNNNKI